MYNIGIYRWKDSGKGQTMLNEEKNKENNIDIQKLTKGSSVKIYLYCDYCGLDIIKSVKTRNTQNKKLDKDCCVKCRSYKRKEICLIEHGVTNVFKLEKTKEKIKKTNIKKYGCEVPINKDPKIIAKSKKTNLERYGNENYNKTDDFKNKYKKTCLEKYGTENVSQNKEVKEKIKETNILRYGSESFLSSEIGKKKIENTMLSKYGVKNAFQIPSVISKLSENRHMKNTDLANQVKVKSIATNML